MLRGETLPWADCYEIWESHPSGILRAYPDPYRDCCTFTITFVISSLWSLFWNIRFLCTHLNIAVILPSTTTYPKCGLSFLQVSENGVIILPTTSLGPSLNVFLTLKFAHHTCRYCGRRIHRVRFVLEVYFIMLPVLRPYSQNDIQNLKNLE